MGNAPKANSASAWRIATSCRMTRPIHGRTLESVVPRHGQLHCLPAAALAVEVEHVVVFIEQPLADLAYSRVELTHQFGVLSQLITLPSQRLPFDDSLLDLPTSPIRGNLRAQRPR